MRISRGCYDKFHRCPGWAGGGLKFPKGEARCDGGRVQVNYRARLWRWRFWRCDTCDVVVWPYATRWLSPSWVRLEIQWRVRDYRYWKSLK